MTNPHSQFLDDHIATAAMAEFEAVVAEIAEFSEEQLIDFLGTWTEAEIVQLAYHAKSLGEVGLLERIYTIRPVVADESESEESPPSASGSQNEEGVEDGDADQDADSYYESSTPPAPESTNPYPAWRLADIASLDADARWAYVEKLDPDEQLLLYHSAQAIDGLADFADEVYDHLGYSPNDSSTDGDDSPDEETWADADVVASRLPVGESTEDVTKWLYAVVPSDERAVLVYLDSLSTVVLEEISRRISEQFPDPTWERLVVLVHEVLDRR